jgi:hypothetical protein
MLVSELIHASTMPNPTPQRQQDFIFSLFVRIFIASLPGLRYYGRMQQEPTGGQEECMYAVCLYLIRSRIVSFVSNFVRAASPPDAFALALRMLQGSHCEIITASWIEGIKSQGQKTTGTVLPPVYEGLLVHNYVASCVVCSAARSQ